MLLKITNAILDETEELTQLGLSVIPMIPNKKDSAVPWRDYSIRIANNKELVFWFGYNDWTPGLVTGKISQNLIAIKLGLGDFFYFNYINGSLIDKTAVIRSFDGVYVLVKYTGSELSDMSFSSTWYYNDNMVEILHGKIIQIPPSIYKGQPCEWRHHPREGIAEVSSLQDLGLKNPWQ